MIEPVFKNYLAMCEHCLKLRKKLTKNEENDINDIVEHLTAGDSITDLQHSTLYRIWDKVMR